MGKFNDNSVRTSLKQKIDNNGNFKQLIPYTLAESIIVADGDIPTYLDDYLIELRSLIISGGGSVSITTNDITHNSDNESVYLNLYLDELKNSVANGKELLANAISTISSVYTQNIDTFTTMASNILELKSFNQYYYLQYPTSYTKYNNTVKNVMTRITNVGYDPFL